MNHTMLNHKPPAPTTQTEQLIDTSRILLINDGPEDKPNFQRRVRPICWSTMPGMVLCADVDNGGLVSVDRQKIEKAINSK